MNWNQVLREPAHGDHIVQTYQDPAFLAEAVAEYLGTGLARGEAAILIARPAHSEAFRQKLAGSGDPSQLIVLDAAQTLARFMVDGMPQWNAFREVIGGLIAQVRLQYPAVRLEEYWNELTRLQTFSLFCAYAMDALDPKAYAGLESVCKAHTHFIAARDEGKLNQAVNEASRKVLDEPLANILLSLAANHQTATRMPSGQATLLWLSQNMPRTADKVLREVKEATRAS
jgi:hypothetical protein